MCPSSRRSSSPSCHVWRDGNKSRLETVKGNSGSSSSTFIFYYSELCSCSNISSCGQKLSCQLLWWSPAQSVMISHVTVWLSVDALLPDFSWSTLAPPRLISLQCKEIYLWCTAKTGWKHCKLCKNRNINACKWTSWRQHARTQMRGWIKLIHTVLVK